MNNRRRRHRNGDKDSQSIFYMRCEECNKRFSLPTRPGDKHPYPVEPNVPNQENIIMCFTCRKKLDTAFSSFSR